MAAKAEIQYSAQTKNKAELRNASTHDTTASEPIVAPAKLTLVLDPLRI